MASNYDDLSATAALEQTIAADLSAGLAPRGAEVVDNVSATMSAPGGRADIEIRHRPHDRLLLVFKLLPEAPEVDPKARHRVRREVVARRLETRERPRPGCLRRDRRGSRHDARSHAAGQPQWPPSRQRPLLRSAVPRSIDRSPPPALGVAPLETSPARREASPRTIREEDRAGAMRRYQAQAVGCHDRQ